MNVILLGLPKSGKTTIGQKLALHLSLSFVDTDRLLEEFYMQQYKVSFSCREIYQRCGEKKFRMLEAKAIFSLQNQSNTIISIGGGAICSPKVVCFLQTLGELVHLQINKKTLYSRLLLDPPVFLSRLDDISCFDEFFTNRFQCIKKIPAHTIVVDNKSSEEVVNMLSSFYREINPR